MGAFAGPKLAEKHCFWLNCCEGKILFQLKKEAEQTEYGPVRWSKTWLKLAGFVREKHGSSWLMNSIL